MRIFINNAEIGETDGIQDVSAVIEYAEKIAVESDSIIEAVFINGIIVEEIKDLSAENIEKVEIFTKKTGILILESFQEMSEYIVRLKYGIKEAVSMLQEDSERDAMTKLEEIANGIDWIFNILESAERLNKVDYKDMEFSNTFDKFKSILPEILESLENKDNIMLSDLLNYELTPIIEEVIEKIPVIYEKILEHEKKELNKKIN